MIMRNREPLDTYDKKPEGMVNYLRYNGWHFNKKMCDFAISHLRKKNADGKEERIEPLGREKVEEILKKHKVVLDNAVGYDHVYVLHMGLADVFGRSVPDEAHLAMYVKDVVDDIDQADGHVFNAWYANSVRNGLPIPWDDVL